MKIGIITMIDNNNYGNRLQNFALQHFLEERNFTVETLKNVYYLNNKKFFFLRYLKNFKKRDFYSEILERKNNFIEFNKEIKFSNKLITAYSKNLDYDFIIVGSDQVWNPTLARLRDVDLLKITEDKKRIAYAASFGTNELPENIKGKVRKELAKFKAIAVREESGKKIVTDLTKRKDIEVLIDPTMLLEKSTWENVSRKPKMLTEKPFILTYFLGKLSQQKKEQIESFAKRNNYQIINLTDKNSSYYECGPREFLYLEKKAVLICTDSFHSCVFSIIFNKPFIAFEREQENITDMSSRIDTLLSKFELENRKYDGHIGEDNLIVNYSKTNSILEKERKKSEQFLLKALDVKKNYKE